MAGPSWGVQLTGQWPEANRILNKWGRGNLERIIQRALRQEAHDLRKRVVKGITSGEPGGKKFKKLSPFTIMFRRAKGIRSRKPLIASGSLRKSIAVKESGEQIFVGVLRTATNKDGESLANIARIQEEGARFTVPVTEDMRAYFFYVLSKYGKGIKLPKKTGSGRGGFARGVLLIRIPPRPFIQPVVDEMFKDRSEVENRMLARISKEMMGDFGRVVFPGV